MMKQFLLNVLLLITALLLSILLFPFGVVVTFINAIREGSLDKILGYLSISIRSMALSLDTMGNTVCRDLMNGWFRKIGGYEFGVYKETISKVLGKNEESGTLTDAGRLLTNLLNFIDPGHTERARLDD